MEFYLIIKLLRITGEKEKGGRKSAKRKRFTRKNLTQYERKTG